MKRLTDEEIRQIFERLNAIHTDSHFVYTSGKHGPHYVNKDTVGIDPSVTKHLAYEIASRLREKLDDESWETIVAVVGAPMGAIRLSEWVAYMMGAYFPRKNSFSFASLYADKKGDDLVIGRGFDKHINTSNGCGVILIEDIINTGKSAKQLVQAVRSVGGNPLAIGALCNRGEQTANSLGVPTLLPLLELHFEAFDPNNLPDWLANRPVRIDLGHGAKFLAEQGGGE